MRLTKEAWDRVIDLACREYEKLQTRELKRQLALADKRDKERYPISPPTPVGAIRFRMEAMGMNQSDLARTIGCPRSRVSEIMRGKRGLTLPLIRTLHTKLGIPLESLVGLGKKRGKK